MVVMVMVVVVVVSVEWCVWWGYNPIEPPFQHRKTTYLGEWGGVEWSGVEWSGGGGWGVGWSWSGGFGGVGRLEGGAGWEWGGGIKLVLG